MLIDAKAKGNDPDEQRDLKYRLEKPDQPLVRLKVEHSGFSTLNNQRVGARFVGLVANPVDILLFHRKKETDGRGGVKRTKASKALEAPMVPQDHDEMKIEDLIKDNLQNADKKLEIIDEAKMSLALDDFVSKEVKQAMFEAANSMLSKQQKKLLTLRPSDEEEDVLDLQAKGQPVEQDDEPEELSAPVNKRARTALMRSAPAPTRTTTKRKAVDDHDDDDDIREIIPAKSSGRPKRQTASSRPKYVVDDEDEESDVEVLDEDNDDEEEEEERISKKRSNKPRSARSSRSKKNNDDKFGNSFGVEEDWSEAHTISER